MASGLIQGIRNASLKNKIFFSTTAVILLVSVLIAVFTRWILISTLTSELKQRGVGIAHSIAEGGRGYLLTENIPQLTSLIFDARLGGRKSLVGYIFITDKQDNLLAHTFTHRFPQHLLKANVVQPEKAYSIQLLRMVDNEAYDVAVPVNEGIYRIGSVHVGLNKKHIDQLINKLRTTFLGFVSAVTVLFFIISHRLSKYITRPITRLTEVSDQISQGNYDIQLDGDSDVQPLAIRDEVRQLSNSFVNMTNRIKESQAQLRESEGKYRSLFTSGPNPIFVLDRKTFSILDANPSAKDSYGYSKAELIGKPFTELGPFDLNEDLSRALSAQDTGRVVTISSKVQYRKKNNETFYVNVHACPATYQERAALIVATTDITEMVEKDAQLIQASKMTTLGQMSAGIAHELNQPLNAIKMGSEYLEMIIEDGRKIPERVLVQVVQEVSSQVDRAVDIILRLRDFGRKADFTKEKIFINDPVNSVLEIIGRQLRLQNIDVQLELGSDLPSIQAHHNRIEQVIFNLLTNARDAINLKQEAGDKIADPRIVIKSYARADCVTVEVSDTGMGIDPTLKERIFEAFFTTKQMGEGMGLGLSITCGIVEDYRGTIEVESTEELGTTFRLSFPAI